ncbi:MAG TPA: hypothetical protein VHX68_07770, partial [Planctomycetaceae bacterium]|nr:hypothetical protein [Planctomycetaceae bacterium]
PTSARHSDTPLFSGTRRTSLDMLFKLAHSTEKRWRRPNLPSGQAVTCGTGPRRKAQPALRQSGN